MFFTSSFFDFTPFTFTYFQHYKRDADGLCHRLITPVISDKYRITRDSESLEDRIRLFRGASLIISRNEIHLGDIIGHGEFGGLCHTFPFVLYCG